VDSPRFEHFIDVEGCRIHWVELGEATTKPPLVLLHGLNDSLSSWRGVSRLLGDRRVLIPDLPGHGQSGRPDASYELGWYAQIMARWFEALDLGPVDVMGHSFGGGVAQVMLLECPARFRRLVLVASGGLGREIASVLRLASIPGLVEHCGQPFMKAITRASLRWSGEELPEQEIERLCAMNAQTGSARAFARTVRDIIDWRGQRRSFFERANELTRLPSFAVFWGDRDGNIPATHALALAEALVGVRVVLFAGCGHYPHHEQPHRFADATRSFLDDPSVPLARVRSPGPDPSADAEAKPRIRVA
jgi:pimeloyl-ACP methyl ester carboxylesterase